MLVKGKDILTKAMNEGYGVGAYNFVNMEILQSIIQAANEEKAPLILQITEGAISYMGYSYLKAFVGVVNSDTVVPTAVHLDHGLSLETVKRVIDAGFTSVMIDASHEPFDRNVEITKQAVLYAHSKGVSVEGELGTIGGQEDNVAAKRIIYTDPDKAKEFVDRTGIDYLAVAIGTSHGAYKFEGETKLNFEILGKIKRMLSIPLVLHGASAIPSEVIAAINKFGGRMKNTHGVDDSSLKKAIAGGICKINTDSDIRLIWTASVRQALAESASEFDLRKIIGPARKNIIEYLRKRMKVLGTSGKG